ncbi:MAG: iron dicitrate transport regulator FecR [Pseudoduganella sp.]|jgi:hypothetical protein|nr:iron dicitrate transport regulator FecR [Pseudoduganella sp.]
MNLQREFSARHAAVRGILLLALWALAALALAAPVAGTVTHLSGPLLARKASGAIKILSVKSEVENGDTLVTEKNTYARVKFIDNSEITLKPGTTLTVDDFSFDEGKPDGDKANFNLVKGGLRSVSGLLGKRNKEKFELKTPAATIGIRGTTFIVEYVAPTDERAVASAQNFLLGSTAALGGGAISLAQLAPPRPAAGAGMPAGLYVSVIDGLINLSNKGGVQSFSAGQFGFTPSFSAPPVIVPRNPGLQFSPPPAFTAPTSVPASSGAAPGNVKAVDCEVR